MIKESKYLPPQSLVLSGNQVFSIFFDGIVFDDIASDGKTLKCNLLSDWVTIQGNFTEILADIAELRQEKSNQTPTEVWYDILKKVMRMWDSTSLAKPTTQNGITIRNNKSDADDFYVFIYDEEDKSQFK